VRPRVIAPAQLGQLREELVHLGTGEHERPIGIDSFQHRKPAATAQLREVVTRVAHDLEVLLSNPARATAAAVQSDQDDVGSHKRAVCTRTGVTFNIAEPTAVTPGSAKLPIVIDRAGRGRFSETRTGWLEEPLTRGRRMRVQPFFAASRESGLIFESHSPASVADRAASTVRPGAMSG